MDVLHGIGGKGPAAGQVMANVERCDEARLGARNLEGGIGHGKSRDRGRGMGGHERRPGGAHGRSGRRRPGAHRHAPGHGPRRRHHPEQRSLDRRGGAHRHGDGRALGRPSTPICVTRTSPSPATSMPTCTTSPSSSPPSRTLLLSKGVTVRTQARVNGRRAQRRRPGGRGPGRRRARRRRRLRGDHRVLRPAEQLHQVGNGCAMCIMRCPTFGGRVSVAAKAGIEEQRAKRMDGSEGVMSGSCKLHFDSVSKEIQEQLRATGVGRGAAAGRAEGRQEKQLGQKACQQYALPEFADNVMLLDTGHVKLMTPYFPLDQLRTIPGLEKSRFEDPYSGGVGNSIRYLAMSPRSDALRWRASTTCSAPARRRDRWWATPRPGDAARWPASTPCAGRRARSLWWFRHPGLGRHHRRGERRAPGRRPLARNSPSRAPRTSTNEGDRGSTAPTWRAIRQRVAEAGLENVYGGSAG